MLAVVVPVPELEGDRPLLGTGPVGAPVDLGRRRSGVVAEQIVVRACADQESARGAQHAAHLGEGGEHVPLRQQVGQRVVGADDDVEATVRERKAPHVGGGRAQAQAPAAGLAGRTGGGAGAEVGACDEVPAQREADGLRSDATGAVEHRCPVQADQGVQGLPLPADARVPVRVDQVVVVGQSVVEPRHGRQRHGQRLPTPRHFAQVAVRVRGPRPCSRVSTTRVARASMAASVSGAWVAASWMRA